MRPPSAAWAHKKGAEALERGDLKKYREVERWLSLSPCPDTHEAKADRFHFHVQHAGLSRKEHNFLYVTVEDTTSTIPWLPYGIYLDNIRSGYNVGNIVRTCEAFRLGTLFLSEATPNLTNKKVKDGAMGADKHVTAETVSSLDKLPRPLIAIETAVGAIPYNEYTFPKSGTLLLGNEEYGLSEAALNAADVVVTIPLVGCKNSLNVANAFAIVAAHLSSQKQIR